MRRATLSLACLLALSSALSAQSVTMPAAVVVKAGRLTPITATYDGDDFLCLSGSDDLAVFREYSADPKQVRLQVLAYGAGPYRLIATAAKAGKIGSATCTVTTEGPPVPPTPPDPPTPPAPTDPLTKALQAAYALDADADRTKSLAFLQAAYAAMASQAPGRTMLKTNADWVAWMKTVVEVEAPGVGLLPTQLKSLRTAIGGELSRAWGGPKVAPVSAAEAAAELSAIAKALSGIR